MPLESPTRFGDSHHKAEVPRTPLIYFLFRMAHANLFE